MCRERCVFAFQPFLKICILSLDSSTLPSSSMTPGKVSRVPATAGKLTAATLLWMATSGRCREPSASACETSISVRGTDPRTGEEELLWRAAATRPCAQTVILLQTAASQLPSDPWLKATENGFFQQGWSVRHSEKKKNFNGKFCETFSSLKTSHSAIEESCDST